jgi:hypothetical protein
MKKMNLKILAIMITVGMLSAVSIGDIPKTVEVKRNPVATSLAIPSAIVWSENFDDGNISNWNIYEINWTLPDGTVNLTADPDDLFDVSEGVLRAIGPEWNFATINSSIAYGTWNYTLDIQKPEESNRVSVIIVGEKFGEHMLPEVHTAEAFRLNIWITDEGPNGRIQFVRGERDKSATIHGSNYVSNILGWHNFIVTRELTGQFYVYLDGTLVFEAMDNTTITYERFGFYAMANPAIDNITISNTIDYDAAPPKWVQSPENQMIDAGTDFYYNLNATDYSEIDQWWINDTVNFAIDNDGVITNTDTLDAGSYVVEVRVNDTLGNTQTGSFRLTVRELPPGFPMELVIGGVGAVVIVIIALVIWKKRS